MAQNTRYQYLNAKRIETLERMESAMESHVPVDDMTKITDESFDLAFDGTSRFYPWKMPTTLQNIARGGDFGIVVITGASGSGKSTLLKQFASLRQTMYDFNDGTLLSNFVSFGQRDTIERLHACGMNDINTWFRPARVLSVGERFRATVARNIDSNVVFDEFTSTIDRNIANDVCRTLKKYIVRHGLKNVVLCSCHRDYIDAIEPDYVVDIDEQCVFDCRDFEFINEKSTPVEIEMAKKTTTETNLLERGLLFDPDVECNENENDDATKPAHVPTFFDERDGDVIANFTIVMANDDVKKRMRGA